MSSSLRSPSLRAAVRGLLASAVLLAAACTDPQGGSQTGHDGGETGHEGACKETKTVVASLEASTPLGFTGGAVLAQAEGTFESPIVWSSSGEVVSVGPEQGEGQVTITVAHAGGEIRHVASEPRALDDGGQEGGFLGGDMCRSRIEVDVELTITTSGGALAETVPAVLSSSDPRHVALRAAIDAEDVAGTLAVTPAMDGFELTKILIDGGMAAGTSYGTITAQVEYSDGEIAGMGAGPVAQWPTAARCDGGGVPLPFDTTLLGFTAGDVVALGQDVESTFTWDGGASTPLVVSLEATDDVACVSVGDAYAPAGISFQAKLHLTSEDGRIASVLDVGVLATADAEGNLDDVQFVNGGYLVGVAPADFESTYGVSGFDVSAYDQASITVNGRLFEGGSNGAIEVLGLDIPPCIEDPSSVPAGGGCEGVTATELGGGSWQ